MKLIALADLPNGIKKNETFEENDAVSTILINAHVAQPIVDDVPATPVRRQYRRRDLAAED